MNESNDMARKQDRVCRDMSEAYASAVADQEKNLVPEDICEAFVSGWNFACEYKDAQYRPRYEESEDAIYINGKKFYSEKVVKELESERINKLIETLEWIASMRYDACWRNDGCTCLVDSAAIALAEYKKEGGE